MDNKGLLKLGVTPGEMFIDLGRDTLSLLDLSTADSTRVWQIASDSTLDASIIAKGILGVMLDTLFVIDPEPFSVPSERRGQEDPAQETNTVSPTETKYFKAYPNPFTNSTTIEYDLGKACEQGCELRLYDLQGRIILQQMLWAEDGKGRISVDMSRYTNGVYYCGLYGNERLLQTEKLNLMR